MGVGLFGLDGPYFEPPFAEAQDFSDVQVERIFRCLLAMGNVPWIDGHDMEKPLDCHLHGGDDDKPLDLEYTTFRQNQRTAGKCQRNSSKMERNSKSEMVMQ